MVQYLIIKSGAVPHIKYVPCVTSLKYGAVTLIKYGAVAVDLL